MCFPFLTITSFVILSELCLHGRHCGKGMFTICLFTLHNYHLHMKKLKSHVNQISYLCNPCFIMHDNEKEKANTENYNIIKSYINMQGESLKFRRHFLKNQFASVLKNSINLKVSVCFLRTL